MAAMSPTRSRPISRLAAFLACALGIASVSLVPAAPARAAAPARSGTIAHSVSGASGQPEGGGQTGGGGQAGNSGTSTSTSSSLAAATLEQCLTAVDPTARSATFNGQMSAVAGTRRMAMQMTVEQQDPGEVAFHTLSAASSGGWRRSEAGVKIYKYVRQVTDLPAPGAFRAIVQFRWLGEKGRVIKRAIRRTPVCVQPDERAKLVVAQVQALPVPGAAGLAKYQVLVRNEGRAAAGPFAVALNIDGVTQPSLDVASLDPAAKTLLQAQAPRCAAGSTIEVVLDPQHQIAEAAGGGESETLPCPLAEASATVARMR
jgi:hypothetical protein